MSKVKVELIGSGVRELLKSSEMKEAVSEAAQKVRDNAGDGYTCDVQVSNRAVARVYADSFRAYRDNKKNNTLLKALHL